MSLNVLVNAYAIQQASFTTAGDAWAKVTP